LGKYIFRGTIYHEDGYKVDVLLKEGNHHWIDNDRSRWRKTNGTKAGYPAEVTWPRLALSTIHTAPGSSPSNDLRLTHEGRVIVFGKGGIGKPHQIRATKLYWVDDEGVKYTKDAGWSVPDGKTRLVLDTITKLVKRQNVVQPKQPTFAS